MHDYGYMRLYYSDYLMATSLLMVNNKIFIIIMIVDRKIINENILLSKFTV